MENILEKKTKLYDYTGKRIETIKVWNKLVNDEIQRVKLLPNRGKGPPWVVDHRPKTDQYWVNDDLSYLPRMGEKTIFRIQEFDENIMTIGDFISATE